MYPKHRLNINEREKLNWVCYKGINLEVSHALLKLVIYTIEYVHVQQWFKITECSKEHHDPENDMIPFPVFKPRLPQKVKDSIQKIDNMDVIMVGSYPGAIITIE